MLTSNEAESAVDLPVTINSPGASTQNPFERKSLIVQTSPSAIMGNAVDEALSKDLGRSVYHHEGWAGTGALFSNDWKMPEGKIPIIGTDR